MRPFHELRVVEIAGGEAGAYCAKLFADLGAQVLKVEPRGGDPRRLDGEPWGTMGTTFAYLNTSKTSTELDLDCTDGNDELRTLLEGADAVIESSSPGPLRPTTLSETEFPRLVRVSISPFGLSGPYAEFRSNAFTDEAIGGHLYLNGEPGREPIRRPGLHAAYQAGTQAFIGAMAALLAREHTGRGQSVEVSHFEGLVSLHQHTTSMWTHGGFILKREGNRQPGLWHPVGVYRCQDGYVQLSLPGQRMVEPFLQAAGLGELLADPRFVDDYSRGTHKDEFDAAIQPWLMAHTVEEIVALGQAAMTPVGPVPGMLDVSLDEHLTARDYWVTMDGAPPLRVPRGPFRVEGHPASPGPPASRGQAVPAAWSPASPRTITPGNAGTAPRTPLEGVRVLDLTRVWAGPLAGRFLADLGADVIAVEMPGGRGPRDVPASAAFISHMYPENRVGERPWNRVGGFNKLFRNRRGITLDLKNPRCREIFAELVKGADVLLENYSPRVMAQLGFDDETLLRLNPHIIHASMPGFGASGPKRTLVAYGPLIEASSGLTAMMGYRDSGPYRSGIAWPDPVSGMNAAAGVLVALWDRESDPERRGRAMEMAMIEAMGAFVGEELLAAQVRGSDPPRLGNRHRSQAPQGCYPCAGADRWVAISVTNDAEWAALCDMAGLDDAWRDWTLAQRLACHDQIDARLAPWTRSHNPHDLMARLQAVGLVAAVVSDARDLVEDPHLAERGFWAQLDHPDVGPRLYPGNAIRLSQTPITYRRPAPTLGQHDDEILHGEVGVSLDELAQLRKAGVIADEPPAARWAGRAAYSRDGRDISRRISMAAIDFMQQTLDFIHRGFRGAPEGLTNEQLHFVPEGQSHSIAWCMWHGVRIEDLFFQQIFQGKRSEWETGGWAAKTGLPAKGFGTGQSTEDARAIRIDDLEAFRAYQARIAELSGEFLAGLDEAGLGREVKLGERTETVGESINLHLVIHLNGHRGEVNLLRGMMGFDPVLLNQGG